MSDVQAILYYSFKIYESESERKNILIVPVYIANEWVFSTKSASSSTQEAAEGNTTPALHQSLFLSSSVKR
jgi:predicted permease